MDTAGYEAALAHEATDTDAFWRGIAGRLDWIKPFSVVKDVSFKREDFRIRWFADGVLNASVNCLDRHLATRGDDVAIIWEGDDPSQSAKITYRQAYEETCRMANVLKSRASKRATRSPFICR